MNRYDVDISDAEGLFGGDASEALDRVYRMLALAIPGMREGALQPEQIAMFVEDVSIHVACARDYFRDRRNAELEAAE